IPILAGYVSHENGHPVPEAAILADLPGFPHSLTLAGFFVCGAGLAYLATRSLEICVRIFLNASEV
ncbi:hypothetical protein, partial [Bradyrhizobium sp. Leaf396]|uniref:hypothetical protein n=1 Tax=Bradyrhizobium sp. Leaf396 TaxID=1736363 RepID=UPI001AECFDBE